MALLLFHGQNYSIQKLFFLMFTAVEDVALKFRTKASIIFCKNSNLLTLNFWFCLKDGYKNFQKLRINFWECNPSQSLSSTTKECSKQSLCSYLVKLCQYFWLSMLDAKTLFQYSKVGIYWSLPSIQQCQLVTLLQQETQRFQLYALCLIKQKQRTPILM